MSRKTTILLASAVALLIAVAILLVIIQSGRRDKDYPGITLPDGSSGSITIGKLIPANLNDPDEYFSFSVTKDTVISLITKLKRPTEYTAFFYSSVLYEETSCVSASLISVHGNLSRIDVSRSKRPAFTYLVTPEYVYGWEQNSDRWTETPKADFSSEDIAYLPSFDDISKLSSELITNCGFLNLDKEYSQENLWTIFIEFNDSYGLVHNYYFSIESGLLVLAQTVYEGNTVYKTAMQSISYAAPSSDYFKLPDKTPVS